MDDFFDDGFDDAVFDNGYSEGQEEGYALFGAYTDRREWASYGGEPESKSALHCCCGLFVILIFLVVLGMICS